MNFHWFMSIARVRVEFVAIRNELLALSVLSRLPSTSPKTLFDARKYSVYAERWHMIIR